jgi:hypothetical protein
LEVAKTGKNPTGQTKLGSKVHLLVDERGTPLPAQTNTTNGQPMTGSFTWLPNVPTVNNIFVRIKAMIMKTYM